jgi:hypothetical protein
MGRTYEPEPISLDELQLIATHLEVISKQISSKVEQIKSFRVSQPKVGNVKNAARALKYLDGFTAALAACLTRLEIDSRTRPPGDPPYDFTLVEKL